MSTGYITLNGERFEDLLHDRRTIGDLSWCTREWSCPKYRFFGNRTPHQVKQEVLRSARVQKAITEVSAEQKRPVAEVSEEVRRILEQMGHNMRMGNIRFLGYMFSKSYKSMYRAIYVHTEGMERYRKAAAENPVLLLPTHRSYNDFLLMSYVCFYYNVPLPVIAAGMDFLGMPAVTMLLRNGGAFFIRRSFGTDQLYWEVFRQYIHSLIAGSEHALEFFVEGTRSRTAKSLCPKIGLLQTVLEMFFTSQVSDITVIPITITYDRTLEENLYAFELLGVPKPKESTSGLVKARGILNDDYGNIFIKFGSPMSVRQFCGRSVDRSVHSRHPRFETHVTPEETAVCNRLAHWVVRAHHRSLALSAFPLVCLCYQARVSQQRSRGLLPPRVMLHDLADEVLWLRELVQRLGALVHLKGGNSNQTNPVSWLRREVRLHSNMFRLTPEGTIELAPADASSVLPVVAEAGAKAPGALLRIEADTVKTAVPEMMLYHYSNQVLQVVAPVCMASLALLVTPVPRSQASVYENFKKLQSLLQREFVFEVDKLEESFLEATYALQSLNVLAVLRLEPASPESTSSLHFLASHMTPFLEGLQTVCVFLRDQPSDVVEVPLPELVRKCQCAAEKRLCQGQLADYRVLSLDMLNNCLICLCNLGAAHKEKRDGAAVLVPNADAISKVLESIDVFLSLAARSSSSRDAEPCQAKL
ncbi:dihydroxyacetone phosphate acyltransferase [Rhipicephalus microplus]|uniref:dihydroxyacetone phosphate acyltransferase n=1 Tax=Rhipicephalus microplus TaxID=6941 RepID=UPI003F6D85EC